MAPPTTRVRRETVGPSIAKVDVRNVFAGNASAERLDDGEETRIISVPSPSFERNRLDLSKPKWWFDGIQPNRQVRAPLPSPVGFVANEVALGTYGTPAPHDDDTFRRIQMFLDVFAPMSASADVGVPPDGKAFRFKRRDQRPKRARSSALYETNTSVAPIIAAPAMRQGRYVMCPNLQNSIRVPLARGRNGSKAAPQVGTNSKHPEVEAAGGRVTAREAAVDDQRSAVDVASRSTLGTAPPGRSPRARRRG